MSSRTEKILENDEMYTTELSRTNKNARLYKQVYNNYEDLDNLPIEDNTDEIDLERLREIVYDSQNTKEHRELKENLDILDVRKRNIDQKRIYDINQILEKAKYENNKLKEPTKINPKPKKDLLTTLGSTELSLEEIEKAKERYQEKILKKNTNVEDSLSITREIKYKNLTKDEEIEEEDSNDLFDDLMGTAVNPRKAYIKAHSQEATYNQE